MQVVSWNCNGLKRISSLTGSLHNLLTTLRADIICLQNTKLLRDNSTQDHVPLENYHAFYHSGKYHRTRAGVVVFCYKPTATPINVHYGFNVPGFDNSDEEGRCIVVEYEEFVVINCYFPMNTSKIEYKMWFLYAFQAQVYKYIKTGKDIIVAGDLGFGLGLQDVENVQQSVLNAKLSSYEEHRGRCWAKSLINNQSGPLYDVYRILHTEHPGFTYRRKITQNFFCRIDYFFATKGMLDRTIENCRIEVNQYTSHAVLRLTLNIGQSSQLIDFIPPQPTGCVEVSDEEAPKPVQKEAEKRIPQCYHSEPCILFKVKKKTKNFDRPYFVCKRPPGQRGTHDSKCDYFSWADDPQFAPMCYHNEPACLRSVKKEGRNHGKWFYSCKRVQKDDKCNFFAWDNELNKVAIINEEAAQCN